MSHAIHSAVYDTQMKGTDNRLLSMILTSNVGLTGTAGTGRDADNNYDWKCDSSVLLCVSTLIAPGND